MEDFIHFLQAAVHGLRSVSGLYHDQEMPGNDMAAFAKLSHVTCVRTTTDGNMSVVAVNLEKGFLAVATYWS